MVRVAVRDRVRDTNVELSAESTATVSAVIEELIATYGLPRTTAAGAALRYDLVAPDTDEAWPGSATLAEMGVSDPFVAELVSPDARLVWDRVRELSRALRAEVDAGIEGTVDVARSELEAGVGRVKAQVHEEVRGLVREATRGVEREITRRIQGLARMLNIRARRTIRRYVGEIAATGAIPTELRALSLATGQLTAAARSALMAPLAGAVIVASAAAGGGVIVANNANNAADDAAAVAEEANRALLDLETQLAAISGEVELARQRAETALTDLADHTRAEDPHQIEPLAQVATHVGDVLAEDNQTGLRASWVGALIDAADSRIDAHLSTEYAGSTARLPVQAGDSLWQIAADLLTEGAYGAFVDCPDVVPTADPSAADIADYVGRLWVANVGVIGVDANVLSDLVTLQVVCPRQPPE